MCKIRKTCKYCDQVFENASICLKHIDTVHTNRFHGKIEDGDNKFNCVTCKKCFENDQAALGKKIMP